MRHRRVQIHTALVLPLEVDVRRLLVQSDAEALQLVLEQLFVQQRLQYVQHHEDQVAGASHRDHLSTTTLSVLCSLDDSREIEQLDLGPVSQRIS